VADALGRDLPDEPTAAADVVDLLAEAVEPGLVAMPSGRFFGFVIGGSHPAALAADWLVGAWDQNAVLRQVTPGVAAVEEVAGTWLLDLLGLPPGSGVGFATGATTANFTGIASGRDALLRAAGWDVARGLAGGPAVRVLAGRERHDSIDLALRYAGLPSPELVDVDDQGRVRPEALADALRAGSGGPTLVLLQAGNLHSGASDPFDACVPLAHEHGAWVHVDGAFGLWAAAAPTYRHLTAGVEAADSWATDAHKTLNVPYDCGVVVVRDPAALTASIESAGIAARVINTPTAFIEDADGRLPPGAIQRVNDQMAELVAKHPGKLYGLASVDAFSGDDGAREVTRAVKDLKLRGLVLESAKRDLLLGAKETRPTLAGAASLGVPGWVRARR
jgi:glutamate/tyrosine decarboxylase-like PLP-dependent enzyme